MRVLVVDDDFRVARIHATFVNRIEGFTVVGSASNGAETLAASLALRPDLILLDLYLPDVFGLDLISRLRLAGVEADIVVISAANESGTIERAVQLGVANYLLKPFTQADLALRLNDYRARAQGQRLRGVGDQRDIDRVFARTDLAPAPAMPKGLSAETAELVLLALAEAGSELSAQECADAVGVSRVSARRYLEYFVGRGTAAVSLRYGVRGRPERRYHLTG